MSDGGNGTERLIGELRADIRALTKMFDTHTEDERAYRVEERESARANMRTIEAQVQALDAKLFGRDGEPGAMRRISARVGAIERWRAYVTGAVGMLAAGLAWVGTVVFGR